MKNTPEIKTGYLAGIARYSGPVTDHFDGRRFTNIEHEISARKRHMLKRALSIKLKPRHEYTHHDIPRFRHDAAHNALATYVNHATTILRLGDVTLLTDPVWAMRIGPTSIMGYKRLRNPGVKFEALTRIDVVLVSHNHYDHLDLPTIAMLLRDHNPIFVAGLGTGEILRNAGSVKVVELDWWQKAHVGKVTITAVPAHHFSARGLSDRNRTLWCGFVIEDAAKTSVYFAGDTAFGSHFGEIRSRFGPVDLALLPIGPFKPEWYMDRVHLSPKNAVRAHLELGAQRSMAIHFGTFRLGDESPEEAAEALRSEIGRSGAGGFVIPKFGETLLF